MDEMSREELLSAYLDGELTEAQQAEAEELLAQPEARQLLEELRAMRTALGELPSYRLEADFAQRVLRRAERDMLAGAASESAAQVTAEAPVAAGRAAAAQRSEERPTVAAPGSKRPLVYVALALAAAVAVVVTNALWIEPDKPHVRDVALLDGQSLQDESPEMAASAPERTPLSKDGMRATPAESTTAVPPPADANAAAADGDSSQRTLHEGVGQSSAVAAKAGGGMAGGYAATTTDTAAAMAGAEVELKRNAMEALPAAQQAQNLALVQCDITSTEAGEQVVSDIFLGNSIVLAQPVATAEINRVSRPDDEGGEETQLALQYSNSGVEQPQVAALYVVATRQQIESTLADLQNRADVFLNVEVQPAEEAPVQQEWTRFNRAATPDMLQQQRSMSRTAQLAEPANAPQAATAPAAGLAAKNDARSEAAQLADRSGTEAAPTAEPLDELSSALRDQQQRPAATAREAGGQQSYAQRLKLSHEQVEQLNRTRSVTVVGDQLSRMPQAPTADYTLGLTDERQSAQSAAREQASQPGQGQPPPSVADTEALGGAALTGEMLTENQRAKSVTEFYAAAEVSQQAQVAASVPVSGASPTSDAAAALGRHFAMQTRGLALAEQHDLQQVLFVFRCVELPADDDPAMLKARVRPEDESPAATSPPE